MKKFTTQEIRDLLNQVYHEEISFSRMVEILNEMVSEEGKPNFKEGDFLHSDWDDENITIIFKNRVGDHIYYHASKSCYFGVAVNDDRYWRDDNDFRFATEGEKRKMLDELAKEGKRWNAENKCIEDIPKRKFQKGDKVRIKDGVSSWSHRGQHPCFAREMDDLIGKTMTIELYCDRDIILCEKLHWQFKEDWLEPYVEELKEGDLAIFWDENEEYARAGIYAGKINTYHYDHTDIGWANAIKFESKEQFNRFIKGEM